MLPHWMGHLVRQFRALFNQGLDLVRNNHAWAGNHAALAIRFQSLNFQIQEVALRSVEQGNGEACRAITTLPDSGQINEVTGGSSGDSCDVAGAKAGIMPPENSSPSRTQKFAGIEASTMRFNQHLSPGRSWRSLSTCPAAAISVTAGWSGFKITLPRGLIRLVLVPVPPPVNLSSPLQPLPLL